MEVIELSEEEDEEEATRQIEETANVSTDEEFAAAGYGINDAEDGDIDLSAFDAAAEFEGDDDFSAEDSYGDGDFDMDM